MSARETILRFAHFAIDVVGDLAANFYIACGPKPWNEEAVEDLVRFNITGMRRLRILLKANLVHLSGPCVAQSYLLGGVLVCLYIYLWIPQLRNPHGLQLFAQLFIAGLLSAIPMAMIAGSISRRSEMLAPAIFSGIVWVALADHGGLALMPIYSTMLAGMYAGAYLVRTVKVRFGTW